MLAYARDAVLRGDTGWDGGMLEEMPGVAVALEMGSGIEGGDGKWRRSE
ncbi:hypothetical protein FACS189472_17000 [Alphaproteobacteria bacterium]|nr:hypothetical protein FACS189472_17000 [Alphaproteobacteria bacterium]